MHSCTCLRNKLDKTSMCVSPPSGPRKGVRWCACHTSGDLTATGQLLLVRRTMKF